MGMSETENDPLAFAPLPVPRNADGDERLTGVEIELGGLDEARVAALAAEHLGGRVQRVGGTEWRVRGTRIGDLKIYLDTVLRKARAGVFREAALALGREVIPVEIVTPPLTRASLSALDDFRDTLRRAGALGSSARFLFGFGVHLNVEVAAETPDAILHPLLAYALIEDWLREDRPIDESRHLLPFTDPYPTRFVRGLIASGRDVELDAVIDLYLNETPSRNRGLDMLPIFAHLRPEKVARVLGPDSAVSARPAFHFRLPDCRIDDADWSLAQEWRRWLLVEQVAGNAPLLDALSHRWQAEHGAVTLFRSHWAEAAGAVLRAHGISA